MRFSLRVTIDVSLGLAMRLVLSRLRKLCARNICLLGVVSLPMGVTLQIRVWTWFSFTVVFSWLSVVVSCGLARGADCVPSLVCRC